MNLKDINKYINNINIINIIATKMGFKSEF